MDPWKHGTRYEDTRTEPRDDNENPQEAIDRLLAALSDLKDFGSGWANKAGAITIPAAARLELELPAMAHWHVLGSPALGVAILVGPRRTAVETLEFLLKPADDPSESDQ
jgi:hypothetical protein